MNTAQLFSEIVRTVTEWRLQGKIEKRAEENALSWLLKTKEGNIMDYAQLKNWHKANQMVNENGNLPI